MGVDRSRVGASVPDVHAGPARTRSPDRSDKDRSGSKGTTRKRVGLNRRRTLRAPDASRPPANSRPIFHPVEIHLDFVQAPGSACALVILNLSTMEVNRYSSGTAYDTGDGRCGTSESTEQQWQCHVASDYAGGHAPRLLRGNHNNRTTSRTFKRCDSADDDTRPECRDETNDRSPRC